MEVYEWQQTMRRHRQSDDNGLHDMLRSGECELNKSTVFMFIKQIHVLLQNYTTNFLSHEGLGLWC